MANAADSVQALLESGVSLDRILALRPHSLPELEIRELAKQWFIAAAGENGPGHSLDVACALLERSRSVLMDPAFHTRFIEGLEGDAPKELKDPIFFTLLREPVVLSSGIVLDRSSILNEKGELRFRKCPFTRVPLEKNVFPAFFLKPKLVDFAQKRIGQIFRLVDTVMVASTAEEGSSDPAGQDVQTAAHALDVGRSFLDLMGRDTYLHEAERLYALRLRVFKAMKQCEPSEWEEAYEDLCCVQLQLRSCDRGAETLLRAVAHMQKRSAACLSHAPPDCVYARLWLQSACRLAVKLGKKSKEEAQAGTAILPPGVALELARLFLRIAKAAEDGMDAPGARVAVYLALRRSGASQGEIGAFLRSEHVKLSDVEWLLKPASELAVETVCDFRSRDDFTELGRLECGAGQAITVTAKCSWKDQGWGNTKGQVRVRLVRGGEAVAIRDLFGICGDAGNREALEPVAAVLTAKDDVVAMAQPGDLLCFEYQVGGGGGHSLHIQGFQAQLISHGHETAEVGAGAAIELPPPWIGELLGSPGAEGARTCWKTSFLRVRALVASSLSAIKCC